MDPAELAEQQLIESEAERPYNRRWIEHYRITYEGFQYIKKGIADLIRAAPNPIGGPKPMSPGEQLAICLFWLAQGGEYRATGTAAGRSRVESGHGRRGHSPVVAEGNSRGGWC